MLKLLLNLFELFVIFYFTYKFIRFMFRRKKNKRNSISHKLRLLIARRIHARLDDMLEKQNKTLYLQGKREQYNELLERQKRKTAQKH